MVDVLNGTTSSSGGGAAISLEVDNPVPVVAEVSPNGFVAGEPPPEVTVAGTGFVPSTALQVNGNIRAATYISATRVSLTLIPDDVANAGSLTLTAMNPAPGGGTSAPTALAVLNPVPGAISLTPPLISAGKATTTSISVTGTNFVSGSVANVNGTARSTTVASSTQLSLQLTVADQASAGLLTVAVVSPAPGGGTSSPAMLTISNPVPIITGASPSSLFVGAAPATVSLAGTGFVSSTAIQVNGENRNATFVSSTQLSLALLASDFAKPINLTLTGVNPTPGGGRSASFSVPVVNPVPGAITLTPSIVAAGKAAATSVSVIGTDFVSSSVVQVNGAARPTTVVSSTELSFQFTVADQASVAAFRVNVLNPAPGGGISPPATFTVATPGETPIISSVAPAQIFAGSGDTEVQVSGPNLSQGETVQWNGSDLPTSYTTSYFGSYLAATVPATLLATRGTAKITVENLLSTPPISNSITLQIVNPPLPTLTSLSTNMVPIGAAVDLTLNGTSFTGQSTVAFNGLNLPITYISPTQLTVTLAASSLATPAVSALTVSNAAGTSSPMYLTAYVPIRNNSMVYNPANGLFYLSVPSAAGKPYGNSVVSVDPVMGALGVPIFVGSEPNRMAITADGKYLWVALDGAAAVRKVDLTTGTVGLQFSIGGNENTVAALAPMPNAPDSVVVSTYLGIYTVPAGVNLAIYDSGVARSSVVSLDTYTTFPWTLIVDGTRNEIYGPGNGDPSQYITYSYDDTGVKVKAFAYSNLTFAGGFLDDVRILGGRMYTGYGQVVDPESGSLLGTFYSQGRIAAQGSITVDASLGKAFILEGYDTAYLLQAFKLIDFTNTADAPVPIYLPSFRAAYRYAGPTGARLTRWGSNGLAFRAGGGFVSFRTGLVRDLSSSNADLSVSIKQSGATTTGGTMVYTTTVTNKGPAAASAVGLTSLLSSSSVFGSVTSSQGTCSIGGYASCDLGNLAAGASATVVLGALQLGVGDSTITANAFASETDPVLSNNQATATTNITGYGYNLAPTISAISPSAVASGSSDTVITVTGSNLNSSSAVLLNGAALATTFVNTTQLTAVVPASSLARFGWASISIANPAPGGGTSFALPLSIFSVLDLGANHILYDPYSRKLVASIGPGTSDVEANSVLTITPETGTHGTSVHLASTPTSLALTSDGQILYTLLPQIGSVARINMLTQQQDFTVGNFQASGYNVGLRDIATQPGSENTVAVDEGEYTGISVFDFDPIAKTAMRRGNPTGIYTGTCLAFPDPERLFAIDLYSSGIFLKGYSVSAGGLLNGPFPYYTGTVAQYLNCFKLDGGLVFSNNGGVLTSGTPGIQVGIFEGMGNLSSFSYPIRSVEPDTSLQRVFFLTNNNANDPVGMTVDSITVYDQNTFMPIAVLPMGFSHNSSNTDPNPGTNRVDLVRWGQDGLAALTTSGQVYLLRGAAVVPELLNHNTAALLTSASATSIAYGSGNTLLTLTGGNFVPGVAVMWNGSYRTTKIVDGRHVSVAIPASDLAQPGAATLTAVNPGATASNPLTVSIN